MALTKSKKIDWRDTNMELIGSKEDRAVKKSAAQTEPAWEKVLKQKSPALFVWRIEKFKVVEWPSADYGKFYSGDSYIVLKIYQAHGNPELLYDIHFWIGMHSTQDEYGTAAYKTVELDDLLDDKPVQHREVEGFESDLFKSYFPVITYLKGGCASGFNHVKPEDYEPRLLHFSGNRNVVVKEVKALKSVLDSNDVFIYDDGKMAWQWNGSQSSKEERFKAAQYLQQLENERHGKLKSEVVDESDSSASQELLGKLSDGESKKSFKTDKKTTGHEKQLFKLSDEQGKLEFSLTASDNIKSQINEQDVWIIDNGLTVFVYVGENASPSERKNALAYAHTYLKETSYPCLPVAVVNNKSQGPAQEEFQRLVGA